MSFMRKKRAKEETQKDDEAGLRIIRKKKVEKQIQIDEAGLTITRK